MEKLLSTAKKEGGKYGNTLTGQHKKTLAIALGATANVFLPTHGQSPKLNLFQDVLS
jgi:hypothetical protein